VATQVVAGVNYVFSCKIKGIPCEVKIFKPLPHTGNAPQVSEVTKA